MDKIKALREEAMRLPLLPGVYIMKNNKGEVIYVGKAKQLKNRVSQYFTRIDSHPIKVYKMVTNVDRFEFIVTASEVEALVLECSLIKQYMPKYNILLKDDKGYFYIKLGKGPFGRITAQKQKSDGGDFLGPYMSFFSVRQSVEAANQVFRLPTCKRVFPRDFKKERPCLNYHIGRCMGVCRGNISEEEYDEIYSQAIAFIKKGEKETVSSLEKEMLRLSENMEFEKAAVLRDKIRAISRISERQTVRTKGTKNKDFFAFLRHENGVMVAILSFKKGSLRDKMDYDTNTAEDMGELVRNFLLSFYENNEIPEYILTDEAPEGKDALEKYFSDKKGKNVHIVVNGQGENKRILALARENAAEKIAFKTKESGSSLATLSETARLLGLRDIPVYIESADISNTGTDSMVGVLIVFKNATPYKRAYKKFAIKDLQKENDPAAMAEIFRRRFLRYLDENEKDEGFKTKPDLILLDGGKTQVNAVKEVLSEIGVEVPVFGIVKDEHHRTRALTDGKGEIAIKRTQGVYKLCADIGEEVHRFAITYHRKKRTKSALSLRLTEVSGVGEKTAAKLLKKYKTIKAIKEKTAEELSSETGIPIKKAEAVIDFLND